MFHRHFSCWRLYQLRLDTGCTGSIIGNNKGKAVWGEGVPVGERLAEQANFTSILSIINFAYQRGIGSGTRDVIAVLSIPRPCVICDPYVSCLYITQPHVYITWCCHGLRDIGTALYRIYSGLVRVVL